MWTNNFLQILGKNKIFGDGLKSVDWLSKINLAKSREDEIRECFTYTTTQFHYPDNLPDFDMLLETFQKDTLDNEDKQKTTDKDGNNCNIFGEKKIDKLIVMDDVPALVDKSNDFSNFLTVSRNLGIFVCTSSILFTCQNLFGKRFCLGQKFSTFFSLQLS